MSFETATPRIASYVIIQKGGKTAFVLRSGTDWMNGFYGFPSGKIEKNEPYTLGAIREAKEEVGIDIAPEDLVFTHVMHRNEGSDWVDIYFTVTKWQGEPYNAEPHMHSELAWLDPQNLPENVIPSVKAAVEHINDGKAFSEYGWS
jgi:8-oxo-dGTP diphosphatase